MKPPIKLQTPNEDKSEFENFHELTTKLLKVSKKELDAKLLADKQRKRNKKKPLKVSKDTI